MSDNKKKYSNEFIKGYKFYLEKEKPNFHDYGCDLFVSGCLLFCTEECTRKQAEWDALHDSEFYNGYKHARMQASHLPERYRLIRKNETPKPP